VACAAVCAASIRPIASQTQTVNVTAAAAHPASGAYVQEPTNPARIATTTPTPTMTSRRRPEPVERYL